MKLRRKRVIKVILEAEKGTKLAATQAILVYDLEINPTAEFIKRMGSGLYRGNTVPGTLGANSGVCSFSVELRGTDAAGMEAGLAILLQGCGLKKTLEVYQVHSTPADDKTISIDVWEDGKKKGLAGAMGTVRFENEDTGGRMMVYFEFFGIWQTPTDEALPAYEPSTTVPMRFQGGSFKIATVAKVITKFNLDMGNNVIPLYDVNAAGGIGYYCITDTDPTLAFDLQIEPVATYDIDGIWYAGTEADVELIVNNGTDKVTFAMPKVQYKEIPSGDKEGIIVYDAVGQCNHSTGDDSVVITAAAHA